ncbi:DUF1285 domain-containing protein [Microvirga guangxiensis]|uniref:DUF1285 domain-containing protein n=1 Tax=Microvirga guangxiensis TaxID=549386 RepID=A0A1G5CBT5_9HYPH|nr:DUF1285 domain-containing protein [Microvirga guangxiensis]SCX99770.1 hypothetical protein SAMN02927923_00517 [Microvirga guangxiensis]
MTDSNTSIPGSALSRLTEALGSDAKRKGPPPVERWNPPYCGEIDMRIAADGSWHYMGSPINRPALVKLFSTVLRRDPERYVLVTPVERVGIIVEDAPFLAVEMALEGEGEARQIAFRTNVDDLVQVGPDHPLRFEQDQHGGVKPYVKVRGDLWALVTRALALDLMALAEEREVEGQRMFGIAVERAFFPIVAASDLGEVP